MRTPLANFLPVDNNLRRRRDPKADLIALDRNHRDLNVAANNDFFPDPSSQHQHVETLLENKKPLRRDFCVEEASLTSSACPSRAVYE
jgi:hypothetical protein